MIKVGFKVGSGDEVSAKILHRLLANRLADATNNKTNKNPKVMQSEPISHDIDSASSDLRWRDIEALFSTISGKIIKNDEETMLIISGFPYAKNQIGDYRIEIIQVKKGIFTASQNSAVPDAIVRNALWNCRRVICFAMYASRRHRNFPLTQLDALGYFQIPIAVFPCICGETNNHPIM